MTPTRHLTTVAAAVALVVLAAAAGPAAAASHDDCEMAQQAFSECVTYVVGVDPAVTPHCCMGLGDVRDMGGTAAQRRALCACILSELNAAGKVDPARAAALPAACKVQVGFIPTKPDFDCSTLP
ncbi:non-specific lipid-transfer protein 1-like [Phragmites australis]|uniref:non-specific lipid-transfer protein 1-like n=1 Tax=Phragmites australis TaxID=29695 RepID=UPI002D78AEE0|nr:non-specific lipid-transfer protein 1-like [Phragmites australis]